MNSPIDARELKLTGLDEGRFGRASVSPRSCSFLCTLLNRTLDTQRCGQRVSNVKRHNHYGNP